MIQKSGKLIVVVFAVFIVFAALYVWKIDKKLLVRDDYFSARLSVNDMLGYSSNRIGIYGDSMVAGINYNASTNVVDHVYSWGEDFPGADIHGTSGAPLEFVLSELRQDGPVRKKAVIIFAGFNNIKHIEQTPEAIAATYAELFHRAKLVSDNVLCIAVPPMIQDKSLIWYPEGGWISNDRIHKVNSKISEICGEMFIDTEKSWKLADSDDGVHPNRLGYKKIAMEVKHKLAELSVLY